MRRPVLTAYIYTQLGKSANGKGEWLCGRANLDESKLFNIFVMLVGYILIQLENINAPKVGAITPLKGVTDKPLTGGVRKNHGI